MFRITKHNKKNSQDISKSDYVYKNFKEFYKLSSNIIKPIFGVYKVAILTDSLQDIKDFIAKESDYSILDITIYTNANCINAVLLNYPKVNVVGSKPQIEVLKDMIQERSILFDKGCISVLYNAIGHTISEFDEALSAIALDLSENNINKVTKEVIDRNFIVENITYPREVVIAFLWSNKNRYYTLQKCIESVGLEVTLYAAIKNIKNFHKEKCEYFKKGEQSNLLRKINTNNLNRMYKIFVLDRVINDPEVLFRFYDGGTNYDII